jgi:hypothetical protein
MCIDSAGWVTVEKTFYFINPAISTPCIQLEVCPSICVLLVLLTDVFLHACGEFDSRL